jgi:hypothetical protein
MARHKTASSPEVWNGSDLQKKAAVNAGRGERLRDLTTKEIRSRSNNKHNQIIL